MARPRMGWPQMEQWRMVAEGGGRMGGLTTTAAEGTMFAILEDAINWLRSEGFEGIEKRLIGRASRREFKTSELFRKRVRMMSSAHKTWHHSFPLHCKHRSIVVYPSTPPNDSPPSYKCNTWGIGYFENRYDTSTPP